MEKYTEEQYIKDTQKHVDLVRESISVFVKMLIERGKKHDRTKFQEPEKSIFIKYTPELDKCEYGSEEYKRHLEKVKVAIEHHYKNNSHHPEHYENGIKDMNLLDIVEMFCDWYAVTQQRGKNSIEKSIEINKERFGYSDDLEAIFNNTTNILHEHFKKEKQRTDQAV